MRRINVKKRLRPWLRLFFVCIITGYVLQYILIKTGLDIYAVILMYAIEVRNLFFQFLPLDSIKEEIKWKSIGTLWAYLVCKVNGDKLGMIKNIKRFLGNLQLKMYKSACFRAVLLFLVFSLGATATAHYHVYEKISEGVELILNIPTESKDGASGHTNSDPIATSSTPPMEESTNTGDPPNMFLTEPGRHLDLEFEDLIRLFFLGDGYVISEWTSAERIAQDTLLPFIRELRSKELPNSFDDIAPQKLQNEIAWASERENSITNSDELDEIIATREKAWDGGYRKYTLATLLGNNQHRYAIEYLNIGGEYSTIRYYYAHSILWYFDALTFADMNDVAHILRFVSFRYFDIANAADYGSLDWERAMKLHEAFEILRTMDI